MEIRKEIETLAIWYIPALIIMAAASALYSGYAEELMRDGFESISTGSKLMLLSLSGYIINSIDNVVVAIWLTVQCKKENGRALLWFLFGFVASFYAALIYIGLKIYEEVKAYNKSLKEADALTHAP